MREKNEHITVCIKFFLLNFSHSEDYCRYIFGITFLDKMKYLEKYV